MAEITLTVGGKIYGGWKKATIRRGLEQVAGTFELEVTERWSDRMEPWPIRHGDACTVAVAGQTVLTGFVDDILPSFDAAQHGVVIVGRDATGDLVDCSAIAGSGQWQGRTLLQVAAALCKPFGIPVTAETPVGAPFTTAALQEGETVYEALERAGRMRGVLLVSDGRGGLVITRAGKERIATALVQGENVLRGSATFSLRDRYSRYLCRGADVGSDFTTADQAASPSGEAQDKGVNRYRPLILIAESPGNSAALRERALWEAAVRMGRSARPVATVQGWSHANGLWLPNRLVPARIPYLRLDREMLIVAVTYQVGEQGTTSELELCRPEAFALLPVPEPASDGDFTS
jgi:prophage tail gpP-like protein